MHGALNQGTFWRNISRINVQARTNNCLKPQQSLTLRSAPAPNAIRYFGQTIKEKDHRHDAKT